MIMGLNLTVFWVIMASKLKRSVILKFGFTAAKLNSAKFGVIISSNSRR